MTQNGFTLIEILISLLLASIATVSIYTLQAKSEQIVADTQIQMAKEAADINKLESSLANKPAT